MKNVFFIIMTIVFALMGIIWLSMGDNVTGGSAIVLCLVCAYWAARNRKRG